MIVTDRAGQWLFFNHVNGETVIIAPAKNRNKHDKYILNKIYPFLLNNFNFISSTKSGNIFF